MSDPELLNELRRQPPQPISREKQTVQTVAVLGMLFVFCLTLYVLATATALQS